MLLEKILSWKISGELSLKTTRESTVEKLEQEADPCVNNYRCEMLQTQDLRVGQADEPCIGLTQENLIENSVQNCLPYILKAYGLCSATLAYSK